MNATNPIVVSIFAAVLSFFIVLILFSLAEQIRIYREIKALEAEIKHAAATMSPQEFGKRVDGYLSRLEACKQQWEGK